MASTPEQSTLPDSNPAESEAADGFGAAFAERSEDQRGQDAKQDGGDTPSNREPSDKAGSEQAPADAVADDAIGKAPEADPWVGLTPEQRQLLQQREEAYSKLELSERSQRGRVGALTKKINALTTAAPARTAPEKQPDGEEPKSGEEVQVSDLDKRLQGVVDEYGDVVGPIAEVLKEVRAEIASLKNAPANQTSEIETDAAAITEALTQLGKVHPDYQAVAADVNFRGWLGDQPQKVIELANSDDPREVSLVLTLFKTERSAAQAPQSSEGGDHGKQDGTATDKRRRQLEGSRQVPGKGQPAATGTPNDFSSAFAARASTPR